VRKPATVVGRAASLFGGQNLSLLVALAALFVWLTVEKGSIFLTGGNMVNIGVSVTQLGLLALPETLVLLSGGIDISLGSTVGVSSVVAALVAAQGLSISTTALAIAAAVAVGGACGLFNAVMITIGRVNPFIVTLGTYTAYQGVTYAVTGGQSTAVLDSSFNQINSQQVGGIPAPVIIFLVVTALFALFTNYTDFGRNIYALGGNRVAARLAGINTSRYIFGIYVVGGLVAGLTGVLLTAQQGAGIPSSGAYNLSLEAITAVVLGGAALTGGSGTIIGTVLGVAILGVVQNGLLILNVNPLYQPIPQGLLLVLAVLIQQWRGQIHLPIRLQKSSSQGPRSSAVGGAGTSAGTDPEANKPIP
jgi:ribose transport system permease protein/L-arabinose transport system permease protein